MTDSEIVKVIEFCSNFGDCKYCQITLPDGIRKGTNGCYSFLLKLALNVIFNKESEKEKMRYRLADTVVRCAAQEQKIKSEAVEEFADLAIKRICEKVVAPTPSTSYLVERCNQEIDNLVKELVGEDR